MITTDMSLQARGFGGGGYRTGEFVPSTKMSTFQTTKVAPLLTLASTARGMWVVNEGSTVTDANLRIVVFLTNDTIIEVNSAGTVTRNVSIASKYSGVITAVKMPTVIGNLEVDWVYFTTYDSAATTARFYAVDMTNGNVHNLYTNNTVPSIGWTYIGVFSDGTAYNKVLLTCSATFDKTSTYPTVTMNIAKGALGTATAPVISNLQTCTVQRLMAAAASSLYGTVAILYACEKGVLGVSAAWNGSQYYGSRYHWAIGNNSTTQPYGGTFGSGTTSTPSHVFTNFGDSGVYVFERNDKTAGSVYSVGQSTSGALGESGTYYIDRLGNEAYAGRPKLGSRDLNQGHMGDVFQVSSNQSYATNFTSTLVVQSDIKQLDFWSHVGILTTVPEPILNGVSTHSNLCTIAIKGTQLYKYDGTYGRIIQ